jgi:hypothetical protein
VLEHRFKIKDSCSARTRRRAYQLQYDYVRRDLLKLLYKRNNKSAAGINAGFIYAVVNQAWPEYVKIGSAIDIFDRLGTYQTSSPLRDYEILDYYFADHRVSEENYIHSLFDDKNNEWCKTSKQHVLTIFKQRKQHYEVPITERKLNEQVFHKQFHNVDSDHGQAGLPNLENYYEND